MKHKDWQGTNEWICIFSETKWWKEKLASFLIIANSVTCYLLTVYVSDVMLYLLDSH